jgi:hypothetical protein
MGVESPNRTAALSPLTAPFISARRIAGSYSVTEFGASHPR